MDLWKKFSDKVVKGRLAESVTTLRRAVRHEVEAVLKEYGYEKKQVVLLHCPEMEEIAHQVVANDPSIELGHIRWDNFPDTWPNLFVGNIDELIRKDVVLLVSLANKETSFDRISLMYYLARKNPKSHATGSA